MGGDSLGPLFEQFFVSGELGVVKPGTVVNGLFSAEDWLPTFLAARMWQPRWNR